METRLPSIKLDDELCIQALDFTNFPSKVLDQIFQYLSVNQLLQIRSTCRSLKVAIDNSSAMSRILLKFPENLVMDRKYRPPALVPVKNLCFSKSRISAMDSWWPAVGENIAHLSVKDCQISYAMLLNMLKFCKNLKSLEYLCPEYPAAGVSIEDMKMDKLEDLKIENTAIFEIVHDFVKMSPNLKKLKMPQIIDYTNLMEHVHVLKNTLYDVKIKNVSKITHEIGQLICLKYLNIENDPANDMILRTVARALPKLEEFAVNISPYEPVDFTCLDSFNSLKSLSIKSDKVYYNGFCARNWTAVNFTVFKGGNLKKLSVFRIHPVYLSLQKLLRDSPNLQEISLDQCHFENWSEIFSLAEKHKNLERLELVSVTVSSSNFCLSEYFDTLKYVRLIECDLPKQLLITFFSLCSELDDVVLESIALVDDEVVLELLQSSERLKTLTITRCPISDVSVEHILSHGLMLEKLTISGCVKVTNSALEKLNIVSNS